MESDLSENGPESIQDRETYAIIGAAMDVHRVLGRGFLETVYHNALSLEFQLRQIPFESQVALPIKYKGVLLSCSYRADFVCVCSVIVEIKAQVQLTGVDEAQLINYLKASGLTRGLLFNFGAPSLGYKRLVLNNA